MPTEFDLLVLGDAKPDLIVRRDAEPAFGEGERLVEDAFLTLGGSGGVPGPGAARAGGGGRRSRGLRRPPEPPDRGVRGTQAWGAGSRAHGAGYPRRPPRGARRPRAAPQRATRARQLVLPPDRKS